VSDPTAASRQSWHIEDTDRGLEVAAPAASDLRGRLLTAVAATVDGIAVRMARLLIDRALMPAPEEVEALRASARFYQQPMFAEEPRRFFGFLDGPPCVPDVTLAPRWPSRNGGERIALTFASPYHPANPAYADEYRAVPENLVVHAELWRHGHTRGRATVIGLHGFGMGYPALDAAVLMAPALFAAGLDVALFTLPLHGPRTPRTTRFSGQLFADVNVPRINESIGQAVHELAALRAWLRANDAGPVGILGLSLGGYVAALMAALMDDLDFVVPVVAPACFGDLAHRFMAASSLYRGRDDVRLSRGEFRAVYRVHSPLAHRPRLPRERLLLLAARGDRVVPAEHAVWLWAHWGGPHLAWFTGSHLVPFGRAQVLEEILAFVEGLGMLPRRRG
jgi:pimeloyl-ACP methyl ester carboxylesterase